MKNEFIALLKKNQVINILGRVAKILVRGDREILNKLLNGYFDYTSDVACVLIEHPGDKFPNETVYYIEFGENEFCSLGFFAMIYWQLLCMHYVEKYNLVPVIKWGEHTSYYDKGMDGVTTNAFEYFYEPLSEIACADIKSAKNLVRFIWNQKYYAAQELGFKNEGYVFSEEMLRYTAEMYGKYFHLNADTQGYIDENVSRLLAGKKTVGVHIRGTNFKLGKSGHPIVIEPKEYLDKAKTALASGKYEQVFLATDDLEALSLFQKELPQDRLVLYSDVFRTEGDVGNYWVDDDRPLHRYKLGLEVLRDAYTLAYCDGLIAGCSSVSYGAQYIGVSLGRKFEEVVILDNGMNIKNGKEAKQFEKELKQRNKSLKKS